MKTRRKDADVIVIGGGLAGLSCALQLSLQGQKVIVLESREVLGGRTSSWVADNGMVVESGLHRFLSFYTHLPALLQKCGVATDDIVHWENKIELRVPDGPMGIFGSSLLRNPVGVVAGGVGNNDILSPVDKASLVAFLTAGLADFARDSSSLDTISVYDYAKKHHVREQVIQTWLYALTAGLFFLPPDRYSAFVLFDFAAHIAPTFYDFREGAFAGGMTEVMIHPIAKKIETLGGEVRTGKPVQKILMEDDKVVGVHVGAKTLRANHVVLAASLGPAKRIISASLTHPWFDDMLSLPTMGDVNIQIELDKPMVEGDHVIFTTHGCQVATFAEQSRITFPHTKGRLSIILSPPDAFLQKSPEAIVKIVIDELHRVGVDIKDHIQRYYVVVHPDDWYSLSPGNEKRKPTQATPVMGLTLAGDYTKQEFLATMEGAVLSGELAAAQVRDNE